MGKWGGLEAGLMLFLFIFSTLGSVECYNPVTNNWFFVAPLSRARSCAAASTLAEKIFVVGGQGASNGVPSTLNVLNTVEVFDPKQNR